MPLGVLAAATPRAGGGGGGDPDWASVSALLHFDGADGSTTLTDQTGKVWTPVGQAQIDTDQSKFGGASLRVDGAGDYATTPNSAAFDFGAGDFTVEAWVRWAGIGAAGNQGIVCHDQIGGTRGWLFFSEDGTGSAPNDAVSFAAWSGGVPYAASDTVPVVNGVWYHLAAARQGGTLRLFKNGVQVGVNTGLGSAVIGAPTEPCVVGALWAVGAPLSGTYLSGNVDDLRITKGVARYTSNFTPPAAPFPNS